MSASSINALPLLEKINDWHAIYATNEILSGAHVLYQIDKTSTQELVFDLVHKCVSVLVNMQVCMDV